MSKMHPAQELSIKISELLIEENAPINVALSVLSVILICACKEENMTKAQILNSMGNIIDTVEGEPPCYQ